ncbi:MAG: dTMP kinase [Candidatus Nanoarchaeia archaeon]|nr:dTMP kinase [Candidatus Nanoarchaeia archaeon]
MIIVFEGTDGSGKGTQAEKLKEYIINKGKKAFLIDFPNYNSPTGKIIKEYLHGERKHPPLELAKLFYEDQLAQRNNLIELQKKGVIVILDRYTLSTKVYQGANLEEKERRELISTISEWQKNLPKEDLTIVFDLPITYSVERIKKRGRFIDIHEKNIKYMKKVHDLYIKTAQELKYPIIKCVENKYEKTVNEIFDEVLKIIKEKIGLIF